MDPDDPETLALLERVRTGDAKALETLINLHRPLLRRFVNLRIDTQLNRRVDASDVVQDALVEIAGRIHEFLERQPMPFRLWLHKTAYENLLRARRKHVAAARRSVERENPLPDKSSLLLARQLFRKDEWPGKNLMAKEIKGRVQDALAKIDETDREILQMRAFEGLDNAQVALVLGIEPGTASKRYGRALLRLRKALAPGASSSET